MCFVVPCSEEPLVTIPDMQSAVGVNGLLVLALGIFPGGLLALCTQVLT